MPVSGSSHENDHLMSREPYVQSTTSPLFPSARIDRVSSVNKIPLERPRETLKERMKGRTVRGRPTCKPTQTCTLSHQPS